LFDIAALGFAEEEHFVELWEGEPVVEWSGVEVNGGESDESGTGSGSGDQWIAEGLDEDFSLGRGHAEDGDGVAIGLQRGSSEDIVLDRGEIECLEGIGRGGDIEFGLDPRSERGGEECIGIGAAGDGEVTAGEDPFADGLCLGVVQIPWTGEYESVDAVESTVVIGELFRGGDVEDFEESFGSGIGGEFGFKF
jgi:hypothetical protein